MRLIPSPETFAISRLQPDSEIPTWALKGTFCSINKTPEELSIVCDENNVPEGIRSEKNWRLFKVVGPLDFSLTGILASIANPLASAKISIFAISSFDTDYFLVPAKDLDTARGALACAGFSID